MRVLLQRVKQAKVCVQEKIVGQIEEGLLLFVGIEAKDSEEDIDYLIKKVSQLRIFNDDQGVMNRSVLDIHAQVLAVSQFTLFASTQKGNRPSYSRAAPASFSQPMFNRFVEKLEAILQKKVEVGEFGADMQVSLVNDGPVTIFLDSHNKQ